MTKSGLPVVRGFRDLIAWQKAMDLATECQMVARGLRRAEVRGLADQIRRSAASIPANIAEGHERDSLGDYLRHLSIARASAAELETHLLLARATGGENARVATALQLVDEVSRLLKALIRALRDRQSRLRSARRA